MNHSVFVRSVRRLLVTALGKAVLTILPAGGLLAQIDLNSGTLVVTPKYLGQNLTTLNAKMYVLAIIGGNGFAFDGGQDSWTSVRPAGSDSVNIRDANAGYATVLTLPYTITTGSTATVEPEVSTAFGLVKGVILVNGAPPAAGQFSVASPNGQTYYSVGSSGEFRMLLGAGSHAGKVLGPGGSSVLLDLPFTVTAGQELDLGTVAVNIGTLTVAPKYLGQSLTSLGARMYVQALIGGNGFAFDGGQASWTSLRGEGSGAVNIRDANAGYATVLTLPYTITSGATTTLEPEIATKFGLVKGILQVNGAPPGAYQYSVTSLNASASFSVDATGAFRLLLGEGSHSGRVIGPGGTSVLDFPFTVSSGQELNLGILAAGQGTLHVTPLYKNQQLNTIGAGMYVQTLVGGNGEAFNGGNATWTSLRAAGAYVLAVRDPNLGYATVLSVPFSVNGGGTTSLSPEISSKYGLVRGTVRINGTFPPANQYSVISIGGNASTPIGSNGVFRMLLGAGSHTGRILGPGAVPLLDFPFTVLAGQEVDLGSPGAMSFLGILGTKGGTASARTIKVSLKNTSVLAFLSTTGKLKLTFLSGQACAPTISAPNPMLYGDFAGGSTIAQTFTLDVTGCVLSGPNSSRFKMEMETSSGTSTTTITVASNTSL